MSLSVRAALKALFTKAATSGEWEKCLRAFNGCLASGAKMKDLPVAELVFVLGKNTQWAPALDVYRIALSSSSASQADELDKAVLLALATCVETRRRDGAISMEGGAQGDAFDQQVWKIALQLLRQRQERMFTTSVPALTQDVKEHLKVLLSRAPTEVKVDYLSTTDEADLNQGGPAPEGSSDHQSTTAANASASSVDELAASFRSEAANLTLKTVLAKGTATETELGLALEAVCTPLAWHGALKELSTPRATGFPFSFVRLEHPRLVPLLLRISVAAGTWSVGLQTFRALLMTEVSPLQQTAAPQGQSGPPTTSGEMLLFGLRCASLMAQSGLQNGRLAQVNEALTVAKSIYDEFKESGRRLPAPELGRCTMEYLRTLSFARVDLVRSNHRSGEASGEKDLSASSAPGVLGVEPNVSEVIEALRSALRLSSRDERDASTRVVYLVLLRCSPVNLDAPNASSTGGGAPFADDRHPAGVIQVAARHLLADCAWYASVDKPIKSNLTTADDEASSIHRKALAPFIEAVKSFIFKAELNAAVEGRPVESGAISKSRVFHATLWCRLLTTELLKLNPQHLPLAAALLAGISTLLTPTALGPLAANMLYHFLQLDGVVKRQLSKHPSLLNLLSMSIHGNQSPTLHARVTHEISPFPWMHALVLLKNSWSDLMSLKKDAKRPAHRLLLGFVSLDPPRWDEALAISQYIQACMDDAAPPSKGTNTASDGSSTKSSDPSAATLIFDQATEAERLKVMRILKTSNAGWVENLKLYASRRRLFQTANDFEALSPTISMSPALAANVIERCQRKKITSRSLSRTILSCAIRHKCPSLVPGALDLFPQPVLPQDADFLYRLAKEALDSEARATELFFAKGFFENESASAATSELIASVEMNSSVGDVVTASAQYQTFSAKYPWFIPPYHVLRSLHRLFSQHAKDRTTELELVTKDCMRHPDLLTDIHFVQRLLASCPNPQLLLELLKVVWKPTLLPALLPPSVQRLRDFHLNVQRPIPVIVLEQLSQLLASEPVRLRSVEQTSLWLTYFLRGSCDALSEFIASSKRAMLTAEFVAINIHHRTYEKAKDAATAPSGESVQVQAGEPEGTVQGSMIRSLLLKCDLSDVGSVTEDIVVLLAGESGLAPKDSAVELTVEEAKRETEGETIQHIAVELADFLHRIWERSVTSGKNRAALASVSGLHLCTLASLLWFHGKFSIALRVLHALILPRQSTGSLPAEIEQVLRVTSKQELIVLCREIATPPTPAVTTADRHQSLRLNNVLLFYLHYRSDHVAMPLTSELLVELMQTCKNDRLAIAVLVKASLSPRASTISKSQPSPASNTDASPRISSLTHEVGAFDGTRKEALIPVEIFKQAFDTATFSLLVQTLMPYLRRHLGYLARTAEDVQFYLERLSAQSPTSWGFALSLVQHSSHIPGIDSLLMLCFSLFCGQMPTPVTLRVLAKLNATNVAHQLLLRQQGPFSQLFPALKAAVSPDMYHTIRGLVNTINEHLLKHGEALRSDKDRRLLLSLATTRAENALLASFCTAALPTPILSGKPELLYRVTASWETALRAKTLRTSEAFAVARFILFRRLFFQMPWWVSLRLVCSSSQNIEPATFSTCSLDKSLLPASCRSVNPIVSYQNESAIVRFLKDAKVSNKPATFELPVVAADTNEQQKQTMDVRSSQSLAQAVAHDPLLRGSIYAEYLREVVPNGTGGNNRPVAAVVQDLEQFLHKVPPMLLLDGAFVDAVLEVCLNTVRDLARNKAGFEPIELDCLSSFWNKIIAPFDLSLSTANGLALIIHHFRRQGFPKAEVARMIEQLFAWGSGSRITRLFSTLSARGAPPAMTDFCQVLIEKQRDLLKTIEAKGMTTKELQSKYSGRVVPRRISRSLLLSRKPKSSWAVVVACEALKCPSNLDIAFPLLLQELPFASRIQLIECWLDTRSLAAVQELLGKLLNTQSKATGSEAQTSGGSQGTSNVDAAHSQRNHLVRITMKLLHCFIAVELHSLETGRQPSGTGYSAETVKQRVRRLCTLVEAAIARGINPFSEVSKGAENVTEESAAETFERLFSYFPTPRDAAEWILRLFVLGQPWWGEPGSVQGSSTLLAFSLGYLLLDHCFPSTLLYVRSAVLHAAEFCPEYNFRRDPNFVRLARRSAVGQQLLLFRENASLNASLIFRFLSGRHRETLTVNNLLSDLTASATAPQLHHLRKRGNFFVLEEGKQLHPHHVTAALASLAFYNPPGEIFQSFGATFWSSLSERTVITPDMFSILTHIMLECDSNYSTNVSTPASAEQRGQTPEADSADVEAPDVDLERHTAAAGRPALVLKRFLKLSSLTGPANPDAVVALLQQTSLFLPSDAAAKTPLRVKQSKESSWICLLLPQLFRRSCSERMYISSTIPPATAECILGHSMSPVLRRSSDTTLSVADWLWLLRFLSLSKSIGEGQLSEQCRLNLGNQVGYLSKWCPVDRLPRLSMFLLSVGLISNAIDVTLAYANRAVDLFKKSSGSDGETTISTTAETMQSALHVRIQLEKLLGRTQEALSLPSFTSTQRNLHIAVTERVAHIQGKLAELYAFSDSDGSKWMETLALATKVLREYHQSSDQQQPSSQTMQSTQINAMLLSLLRYLTKFTQTNSSVAPTTAPGGAPQPQSHSSVQLAPSLARCIQMVAERNPEPQNATLAEAVRVVEQAPSVRWSVVLSLYSHLLGKNTGLPILAGKVERYCKSLLLRNQAEEVLYIADAMPTPYRQHPPLRAVVEQAVRSTCPDHSLAMASWEGKVASEVAEGDEGTLTRIFQNSRGKRVELIAIAVQQRLAMGHHLDDVYQMLWNVPEALSTIHVSLEQTSTPVLLQFLFQLKRRQILPLFVGSANQVDAATVHDVMSRMGCRIHPSVHVLAVQRVCEFGQVTYLYTALDALGALLYTRAWSYFDFNLLNSIGSLLCVSSEQIVGLSSPGGAELHQGEFDRSVKSTLLGFEHRKSVVQLLAHPALQQALTQAPAQLLYILYSATAKVGWDHIAALALQRGRRVMPQAGSVCGVSGINFAQEVRVLEQFALELHASTQRRQTLKDVALSPLGDLLPRILEGRSDRASGERSSWIASLAMLHEWHSIDRLHSLVTDAEEGTMNLVVEGLQQRSAPPTVLLGVIAALRGASASTAQVPLQLYSHVLRGISASTETDGLGDYGAMACATAVLKALRVEASKKQNLQAAPSIDHLVDEALGVLPTNHNAWVLACSFASLSPTPKTFIQGLHALAQAPQPQWRLALHALRSLEASESWSATSGPGPVGTKLFFNSELCSAMLLCLREEWMKLRQLCQQIRQSRGPGSTLTDEESSVVEYSAVLHLGANVADPEVRAEEESRLRDVVAQICGDPKDVAAAYSRLSPHHEAFLWNQLTHRLKGAIAKPDSSARGSASWRSAIELCVDFTHRGGRLLPSHWDLLIDLSSTLRAENAGELVLDAQSVAVDVDRTLLLCAARKSEQKDSTNSEQWSFHEATLSKVCCAIAPEFLSGNAASAPQNDLEKALPLVRLLRGAPAFSHHKLPNASPPATSPSSTMSATERTSDGTGDTAARVEPVQTNSIVSPQAVSSVLLPLLRKLGRIRLDSAIGTKELQSIREIEWTIDQLLASPRTQLHLLPPASISELLKLCETLRPSLSQRYLTTLKDRFRSTKELSLPVAIATAHFNSLVSSKRWTLALGLFLGLSEDHEACAKPVLNLADALHAGRSDPYEALALYERWMVESATEGNRMLVGYMRSTEAQASHQRSAPGLAAADSTPGSKAITLLENTENAAMPVDSKAHLVVYWAVIDSLPGHPTYWSTALALAARALSKGVPVEDNFFVKCAKNLLPTRWVEALQLRRALDCNSTATRAVVEAIRNAHPEANPVLQQLIESSSRKLNPFGTGP